ncbi:hypothetical protein Y032_0456g1784 [Ancylostoma ceylanicum]|uniref:Uncharacterized protein n=1 Tax=Ancylostoma ceylanicum TaxID=53326 RepID=A0A016X038_9BILA|nr:hypothetical protein Y032_0456g1784 [Ancylostoma ceylanicum]
MYGTSKYETIFGVIEILTCPPLLTHLNDSTWTSSKFSFWNPSHFRIAALEECYHQMKFFMEFAFVHSQNIAADRCPPEMRELIMSGRIIIFNIRISSSPGKLTNITV